MQAYGYTLIKLMDDTCVENHVEESVCNNIRTDALQTYKNRD